MAKVRTHFINRPPLIPPTHFQDRHVETGLIGRFLRAGNMRLMTVVGRGGVGKTAMVCRLLRALEGGRLPDDLGELTVDGIVYLSARSGHPVNFPNLYFDLCKLLPEETAKSLDQLYKDPRQSCTTQMQALLTHFPGGRTVVLLDNFEDVVDAETQAIGEGELEEGLRAVLDAPPHGLKFIVITLKFLADTMVREGRFKDAIRAYEEALVPADDTTAVQFADGRAQRPRPSLPSGGGYPPRPLHCRRRAEVSVPERLRIRSRGRRCHRAAPGRSRLA